MSFSDDIETIETSSDGEEVTMAIKSALQYLSLHTNIEVDVDEELAIINSNVEGRKIRMAVHDALQKIADGMITQYTVTYNWYSTMEEYYALAAHDANSLYAIGGDEGNVQSYERMFKGDTELQRLYRQEIIVWTKPDPTIVTDESFISVIELDNNLERVGVVYTANTEAGIQSFEPSSDKRYEIHYGSDWMSTNNGIISMQMIALFRTQQAYIYVISLPDNTITLPEGWCQHCTNLVQCDLTNTSITRLYGGTFFGCTSLRSVGIIPATVTEVIGGAFYNWSSNGATITFADGDSPLALNDGSIWGMPSITTLSLPSRTSTIGSNAFNQSTITELIIDRAEGSISGYPWGATSIGTIRWIGET